MISSLDIQLTILSPVNHFSTHLSQVKAKPYGYTFDLITLLLVHHQVLDHHDLYFHVHAPSLCDHVTTTPCHFAPSTLVLLCLTQITLTQ